MKKLRRNSQIMICVAPERWFPTWSMIRNPRFPLRSTPDCLFQAAVWVFLDRRILESSKSARTHLTRMSCNSVCRQQTTQPSTQPEIPSVDTFYSDIHVSNVHFQRHSAGHRFLTQAWPYGYLNYEHPTSGECRMFRYSL